MKVALVFILSISFSAVFASGPSIVKDPYKYVLKNADGESLLRYSLDINDDKIPDLFVGTKALFGAHGGSFHVFLSSAKPEYKYLGKIDVAPSAMEILPAAHSGIHDIKTYWHQSAEDGYLSIFSFSGKKFERKQHRLIKSEAFATSIKPIDVSVEESGPTLDWKPWTR